MLLVATRYKPRRDWIAERRGDVHPQSRIDYRAGTITDIWHGAYVQSDDERGQEAAMEGKITVYRNGCRYERPLERAPTDARGA